MEPTSFRFMDLPLDLQLMVFEQLPCSISHHKIPVPTSENPDAFATLLLKSTTTAHLRVSSYFYEIGKQIFDKEVQSSILERPPQFFSDITDAIIKLSRWYAHQIAPIPKQLPKPSELSRPQQRLLRQRQFDRQKTLQAKFDACLRQEWVVERRRKQKLAKQMLLHRPTIHQFIEQAARHIRYRDLDAVFEYIGVVMPRMHHVFEEHLIPEWPPSLVYNFSVADGFLYATHNGLLDRELDARKIPVTVVGYCGYDDQNRSITTSSISSTMPPEYLTRVGDNYFVKLPPGHTGNLEDNVRADSLIARYLKYGKAVDLYFLAEPSRDGWREEWKEREY